VATIISLNKRASKQIWLRFHRRNCRTPNENNEYFEGWISSFERFLE
jgi:hypothetical protein